MKKSTHKLTRSGLVAGFYLVLSLITFPIASGTIQFRVSEALTILPLIFPETVIALGVGCLLSNLITGCVLIDVIFGSLVTLCAGALTFLIGKVISNSAIKIFVGGLFPVLLNAFLLPLIWIWGYGALEHVYFIQVVLLFFSQSLSVYALGTPLILSVKKMKEKGIGFLS